MKTPAIWLPLIFVFLGILLCVNMVVLRIRRRRQVSLDDLSFFARHVNLRVLQMLIDPKEEAKLRATLSTSEFRKVQRKRIFAALEQFWRILHNAKLFLDYARSEFTINCLGKNPATFNDRELLIISVIRYSREVKRCSWGAVVKTMLWIFLSVDSWSILPSPSLSDMRQSLGVDILGAYADLVGLIGQMTNLVSGDQNERVMAAL